jgi:hypothetical protein
VLPELCLALLSLLCLAVLSDLCLIVPPELHLAPLPQLCLAVLPELYLAGLPVLFLAVLSEPCLTVLTVLLVNIKISFIRLPSPKIIVNPVHSMLVQLEAVNPAGNVHRNCIDFLLLPFITPPWQT